MGMPRRMLPNLRDMLIATLCSILLALAALVAVTQPATGYRFQHVALVRDVPASALE